MNLSPGNKYKLKERGTEDRTGTVVDQHVYESGDEDGANVDDGEQEECEDGGAPESYMGACGSGRGCQV